MSLHGFLQGRGPSVGVSNDCVAAAAAAVAATTACGLGALLLLLLPCSVPRCLSAGNYLHSFGDDPPFWMPGKTAGKRRTTLVAAV